MEAGWVVTEVGRQPWIVRNYLKVEDAATTNGGVWVTFLVVAALYLAVGVTDDPGPAGHEQAVARGRRPASDDDDGDVPYGPRPPEEATGRMTNAVAVVLFVAITAYAVFGGADFGAGFWDLMAGGAERGERPRALIDHSIGPVWEANHVWLIFSLVVLWTAFSEAFASITLTLFVPLTPRRARHRAPRLELRVPQGGVPHPRPAELRRRLRRVVGARAVLHGRGGRRHRLGTGARRRRRPATRGRAGSTRRRSWAACSRSCACAYLAATYLVWDARRLEDRDMVEYFRRRADRRRGGRRRSSRFVGIFVLHADATYVFDGLTSRALPLVHRSRPLCGVGSLVLLARDVAGGARLLAVGAVASVVVAWGVAQWPYLLPTSLEGVRRRRADRPRSPPCSSSSAPPCVIIIPCLGLLYVLDQKSLLPDEGVDTDAARQAT